MNLQHSILALAGNGWSDRPLEEWDKLLGDLPTAGASLDRFLPHTQTIAITGRSYWLKDHATIPGKEDKNKKTKSKPNDSSTPEPASRMARFTSLLTDYGNVRFFGANRPFWLLGGTW